MADRVTVIGWDGTPPTEAARSALGAATLVAGARHLLALPDVPAGAERVLLETFEQMTERPGGTPALEALRAASRAWGKPASDDALARLARALS